MAMRSGEERIGQPTWTNMFRINLTGKPWERGVRAYPESPIPLKEGVYNLNSRGLNIMS